MQKIIDKLNFCKNLLELADFLETFSEELKTVPNKNKPIEELFSYLSVESFYRPKSPYVVLTGNDAVKAYLSNYWISNSNKKESFGYISKIIEKIRNEYIPAQSKSLSPTEIHTLMTHANDRFGFIEKVIGSNQIEILVVENSLLNLNALHSATIIGDEIINKIIIPHSRLDSSCSLEYTFFHELGHVLHTRATKQIETIPASFRLIQEHLFPININCSLHDQCELFADCFAISALAMSEHEKYSPYNFILKEDKIILISYMINLIHETF